MCSTTYPRSARESVLLSTSSSANAIRSSNSTLDRAPGVDGGSRAVGKGPAARPDAHPTSPAGSIPARRSNRWSMLRRVTSTLILCTPTCAQGEGGQSLPDTQVLSDDALTKSGMETLTPLSKLGLSFRSNTAYGLM